MNYLKVAACLILLLILAPRSLAQVYTWTDENGVKHYSNVAPPDAAVELRKDEEIPLEPSASPPVSIPAESDEPPEQSSPQIDGKIDKNAKAILDELRSPEKSVKQNESPPEKSAATVDQALSQGDIVANEKAHVKQLQTELENDPGKRDAFVTSEKERLMQTLEGVRKMPTSQFGSSRNKNQRLGYYQYRLNALENNPDTYFEYGDSDSD